ncbi:MAG: ArsC family transcriptional regulator [Clostridia bacterium]|nr:ArsC family transcriptional regulator [Clostridia bacterium]
MGIQIYCGKGFDTQKAERFFKERRIPYQRVDILKYGIGKRELESVAAAVGIQNLCDRESKAFRESVVAYTQDRERILAGLLEKPALLRLPLVRCGRLATAGYAPEIWQQWIDEGKTK